MYVNTAISADLFQRIPNNFPWGVETSIECAIDAPEKISSRSIFITFSLSAKKCMASVSFETLIAFDHHYSIVLRVVSSEDFFIQGAG